MNPVIGIDLGTTNSVVAELVDGRPRAIRVDGSPIVPSVVLYQLDGSIIAGQRARNLALQFPERTVRSVKRQMGRVPLIDVAGRKVRPEEVSAEILRTLVQAARDELGVPVTQAVITVPAYFDDAQRRATLAAGELAGLTVLRLLNEPTSASLVYDPPIANSPDGAAVGGPELMLVYDLGGGTFDVSVLEVLGDIREVRASAGNSALGGDDFDEKLLHRFVDEIRAKHRIDVTSNIVAMARLRRAAENAKIALSRETEVSVHEEFLAEAEGAPVHLNMVITRRELETMLLTLLESTIDLAETAIEDAKLAAHERLGRICLVGGSTRIPLVRQLLGGAFEAEIHEEIDPDLAVGLGAAMQAGLLLGAPVARLLVDVAAHSLGIRSLGIDEDWDEADHFAPVLRRNTALPAERAEEFYTAVPDQESVRVEVFQGESARASDNTFVGEFTFPLRPSPAGSPVEIRFSYDLDGVIRVTASQQGGEQKTVSLKVADAGDSTESQTPIARRARALLAQLSEPERTELQRQLDAYEAASGEAREAAENVLLDLFLEYEGDDDDEDDLDGDDE